MKIEAIGLESTVVEDISGGIGRLLLLPSAIAMLRVKGIRKKQRQSGKQLTALRIEFFGRVVDVNSIKRRALYNLNGRPWPCVVQCFWAHTAVSHRAFAAHWKSITSCYRIKKLFLMSMSGTRCSVPAFEPTFETNRRAR